jgi:F-type H+-transporting ATPase subunit b
MNSLLLRIALRASVVVALAAVGPFATVALAQQADHSAADHAHAAAADHGGPNPLAVDLDLAIWTGVVFVLLFAVLRTFAWPQIVVALEERERRIADNIAAAEAQNEKARQLLAEHEARLAATAGEIRELLEEAKRDAEHTRKSIADKGHQDAQDELARALREIGRAKDGAVQELAIASANAAIDLARNFVSAQLTSEQQNQLVRDALGKFASAVPSKN